ncbi:MAG TPA: GAF domain-containing protein [Allocoleopsis sp.]
MTYEYKVGGSLPEAAPTYVWRKADRDLYNSLQAGTFCYVLNSRQMGKSSLRVQTMRKLQEAGVACAAIDLTQIISPDITRSQFYASITSTLAKSFNLIPKISDFNHWWREYELLPAIQRLDRFIKEVLLKHSLLLEQSIVIFVDEVDSVLRLPFPINDFFGLIRSCHESRADQPEYNRLTFAILGVASPSDLIRDNTHGPPFNFGQAIELVGFQFNEAQPLAQGLKVKSRNYKKLIEAVLSWTGGQPFLTQKVCKLIIDSEDSPPRGKEADWVKKLVRSRLIENWDSHDEPEHLRTIRERLCRGGKRSARLVKLYLQILQQDGVAADDTPQQMELRLSGLVAKHQGKLKVRNRIYESVFNQDWAEKALLGLEPKPKGDDEFQTILDELERKLLVTQLAHVAEGKGSEEALYEVLRAITLKIGDLLSADRTTVYLLNEEQTELWSIVAENEGGKFLDIQVSLGEGIAGQAAQTKQAINIPANVYQDSRSDLVIEHDKKYGYYTHNILAFPILNEAGELVAVVQFLNKLRPIKNDDDTWYKEIDDHGFTQEDEERLCSLVPPIRKTLESCQSCYKATKKLRATAALAEATRSLDKASLDTQEILQRVMDAAQKLMNADRSTLWLIDRDSNELWTNIPQANGSLKELRVPLGVGFVGKVAQTGQPVNIPFDLYAHPDSETAKKTDRKTGYRTCSLLCMPVLNPDGELLGVTQLVNKRKPGDFPDYNHADWPQAPEQFKASFDENDRQSMQVFNERAGVILQYAKTHETLKQIAKIKPKEGVHNTLSMLSQAVGNQSDDALYNTLYNLLNFTTQSIGKLIAADRTAMFFLTSDKTQYWTLVTDEQEDNLKEVHLSICEGGIEQIIESQSRRAIAQVGTPDRKLSLFIRSLDDRKINYPISSTLTLPLYNQTGKLVALIEFLNKLQEDSNPKLPLSQRIDPRGFTRDDEERLEQRAESLVPILEGFQSFHREIQTIQGQRAIDVLWSAISSVNQSNWHPKDILHQVMEAATKLTNADRSSLWLVDRDRGDLWTELPGLGEVRCKFGVGFVGQVAESGQAAIVPFDLYDHPNALKAKKTDRETGYRTCSLLCMPVLNPDGELLGVTQLVNKRKSGNFAEYNSADWPTVPDQFKTSFNERDRRYMEIFNNQVGVVLHSAQQQDRLRHEISSRLSNATPPPEIQS